MARVALVKLFTGLNGGVSQLSGELLRAGHESVIVYFKDFLVVPAEERDRYLLTDYALTNVAARGQEYLWNCYRPFTDREYELLIDTLRAFKPDLIGFGLTSLTMKPAAEVTAKIKEHFDVPVIWGGVGPTLEPGACRARRIQDPQRRLSRFANDPRMKRRISSPWLRSSSLRATRTSSS